MLKIKNRLIYDEIYLNEKDELTEGARSNVVIEKNGVLYTPPVKCGLLNGTYRQSILNQLKEKILYINDLIAADKIFCINSTKGMVKVFLDTYKL